MPENHFLKKLNEVIDWHRFTNELLKYCKGEGEAGSKISSLSSPAMASASSGRTKYRRFPQSRSGGT